MTFLKEIYTFANGNLKYKMKRIVIIFIGIFTFTQINAQLLNEIGVSVGGTNYTGDIGNELFIYPNNIGWAIKYKKNINSRISYRGAFSYIPITDDPIRSFNKARRNSGLPFTNVIKELSFGIEFNYFSYDVLSDDKGHTPYLFIDVAGFFFTALHTFDDTFVEPPTYKNSFAYSVPFGVGYKSKITDYLGYALELKVSPTFEDDLDYSVSQKIGNPSTNDWYYFTGFTLTYSFGRMPCYYPRPF